MKQPAARPTAPRPRPGADQAPCINNFFVPLALGFGLGGALTTACAPDTAPPPTPAPSLFTDDKPVKPPTQPAPAGDTPTTQLNFVAAPSAWKLAFTHHAGRSPAKWMPETMTGGVAIVDINRDGAPDVVFVDGGDLQNPQNPDVGPRLWLSTPSGFVDTTASFGLTHRGYGMGVAAGDYDNDGWIDLYLTTYTGDDRLLRNEAGKRFVDVTAQLGIEPQGWSTSAAFFDLEGDGDLDLYVARYVEYALDTTLKCYHSKIHVYCAPGMYTPLPDRVFRNDNGAFVDISEQLNLAQHAAKGLALATGDFDRDGDTDLYVADDISRNLLLTNEGGTLKEQGVLAGVAYSELGREEASMGVAVADSNDDGQWDLAVTNFQAEPTSLYTLKAPGVYRERSDAAGIGASSRARLSFGIAFFDADNDGDEDLITANGHIADNVASYRQQVGFAQQNSLYIRTGPGTFTDASNAAGPALQHRGVSRGLAVGDLDNDGRLDFIVVDNDGPAQVVRNATEPPGHFLSLWLEGQTSNRSAIGATVQVTAGDKTMVREVRGGSSYLSVSDRRVHVGLGATTSVDEVEIRWPNGELQKLGPQAADQFLHVVEGKPPVAYTPGKEQRLP